MKRIFYFMTLGSFFPVLCLCDATINYTMVGGNGYAPAGLYTGGNMTISGDSSSPISGTSYSGVALPSLTLLQRNNKSYGISNATGSGATTTKSLIMPLSNMGGSIAGTPLSSHIPLKMK